MINGGNMLSNMHITATHYFVKILYSQELHIIRRHDTPRASVKTNNYKLPFLFTNERTV